MTRICIQAWLVWLRLAAVNFSSQLKAQVHFNGLNSPGTLDLSPLTLVGFRS